MKKYIPYLLSLFAFVIFALTAFQSLTYTDNGELSAVAVSLGISHPTGYPVFILLSHLWSLLPLGLDVVYQLNLFAGLLVSVAVFFIYKTLELIFSVNKLKELSTIILSSGLSLSFAFGNVIWQQATLFEVYPLHILFLSLILYYSFKLIYEFSEKNLLILFFLFGLSFTNHLTTILLSPGLLLLLFFDNKFKLRKLDRKIYLYGFGLFFIALSIYAFLPIRASFEPMFNWGGVSRSLDKFLYHVGGKQYQVWMFTGVEAMKVNLAKLPAMLWGQFQFLLIVVAIGLFYSFKSSRYIFTFLLILAISTIFYSINYTIHDIEPYFNLLIFAMLFISAFGMIFLLKKNSYAKYLSILFFISLFVSNFQENDNSDNDTVELYTKNVVDLLDSNAVVISAQWDFWISAFWFEQKILNKRPDIILIEKEILRRTWYPKQLFKWYPDLKYSEEEYKKYQTQLELFESEKPYNQYEIQSSFLNLLKSFIDENIDTRPVYLTLDVLQTEPDLAQSYIVKPVGLAFRIYKNDSLTHNTKLKELKLEGILKRNSKYLNHLDLGMRQFISTCYVNIARQHIRMNQLDSAKIAANEALKFESMNQYALQMLQELR